MKKDLIHSRFKKHLKDYDKNAKVQKLMAGKLITLCNKKKYKNILEIGCGTGLLSKEIVKNIEFENYTAIDIVEDCEPFIKNIDERIKFVCGDVENFTPLRHSVPLPPQGGQIMPDLIISNAALQWTNNFEDTVNNLKSILAPKGELIFSTFGKENFREIFYIMGTSLKYYSENELKEMFKEAVIYPQEIHIMSFKEPKDVLKHLQLTGVNGIENKSWTKSDLKHFEDAYKGLCVKIPTLTYNPVYIKIQNKTVG